MADSHQPQTELDPEPATTKEAIRTDVFTWSAWPTYFWLIVAAVVAGLAAWLFRWLDLEGLAFFRFLQGERALWGLQIDPSAGVLIAMGTITISMACIMRLRDKYFPGTEGTGIPQAIAALHVKDGPIRRRMLSVRIAIGKSLLLAMGLFTGPTIGREGPSVHVGACAMYLVSKFRKLPDHLVQRGLILGGGGAGIAAAFNAPIAGMVFAFEEIGRCFDKRSAATVVRTVLIASLVVVGLLGWDYLFYGAINRHYGFGLIHWIAVPVIAMIGGTLGGLFARSVVWGTPKITRCCGRHPWLTGLALGATLALIGLASQGQSYGSGYPQAKAILMYRGTDFYELLGVDRAATHAEIETAYKQHNAAHPLLTTDGSLDDKHLSIQTAWRVLADPDERDFYDTWHLDQGDYPWWYPVAKAGGSFFTLISGIPGGLFDPSLSVGAGLGNACADLFSGWFDDLQPQFVIMLFMVAYFAGVVQSPITVFVIMIEMTDARFVTLPLMATAIIAYECSHLVCRKAIYEALAEQFLARVRRQQDSSN
ncbi:MAG: chloride channel protein [Phycisphaerales bacterium]|nr:chloride channel protein [Phycisphaerales bacterium]